MISWQPAVAAHDGPEGLPPFAVAVEPSRYQLVKEVPLLVLMAILIAFGVKTFVAQAFYIPSASMVPQLEVGDRVVVSKLAYDLHDPRRGDVIVFDAPPNVQRLHAPEHHSLPYRAVREVLQSIGVVQPSTEEYIKRVIALPGETVEGRNGHVFVNGRQVVEPYLPAGTTTTDFPALKVPSGALWVMGDNRTNSSDSRVFGPIRRSSVVGRAILRLWPFGRAAFL